jgi:hypothetical protein
MSHSIPAGGCGYLCQSSTARGFWLNFNRRCFWLVLHESIGKGGHKRISHDDKRLRCAYKSYARRDA